VACRIACGEHVEIPYQSSFDRVGFWLMLQPPLWAGMVATVDGLSEISALDGIDIVRLKRPPGDVVDWREGTDSDVVTVRGTSADHDSLAKTVDFIRRKIVIGYDDRQSANVG
jgi:hypothetical protein